MNYWIVTDTHFGHDKLIEYCSRPIGFENLLLKRIGAQVRNEDVLIHLGDICIGNDAEWHLRFMTNVAGKKWLVKGNHDRKSNSWYLGHGWDFVADQIAMRLFGLDIVLSHIPVPDNGYDINVHGHFHNSDHHRHEEELKRIKTEKHRLVYMEHDYQPKNLRRVVSR